MTGSLKTMLADLLLRRTIETFAKTFQLSCPYARWFFGIVKL